MIQDISPVAGYPLPQEICLSYILTMVRLFNFHSETSKSKNAWLLLTFKDILHKLLQCDDMSLVHWQDEEDLAYSMDDLGNIELSEKQPSGSAEDGAADAWGDGQDDQAYLEVLDEFERSTGEIPDQLLLECVADFDAQ